MSYYLSGLNEIKVLKLHYKEIACGSLHKIVLDWKQVVEFTTLVNIKMNWMKYFQSYLQIILFTAHNRDTTQIHQDRHLCERIF